VFLGTTFLIYLLVWALPGDPFAGKCGERACPAAYVARMREEFHLDENIVVQYLRYVGNLVQGDFGQTFSGTSVGELIAATYPVTLRLAIVALLIEAVIGVLAGVLTGLRSGGFLDNVVLVASGSGSGSPARSPSSPRSSSATSRCRPWTCRSRPR
jgi:oligopeptide transport system permease protein